MFMHRNELLFFSPQFIYPILKFSLNDVILVMSREDYLLVYYSKKYFFLLLIQNRRKEHFFLRCFFNGRKFKNSTKL